MRMIALFEYSSLRIRYGGEVEGGKVERGKGGSMEGEKVERWKVGKVERWILYLACSVLYYTIVYYSILYCTALYYSILY